MSAIANLGLAVTGAAILGGLLYYFGPWEGVGPSATVRRSVAPPQPNVLPSARPSFKPVMLNGLPLGYKLHSIEKSGTQYVLTYHRPSEVKVRNIKESLRIPSTGYLIEAPSEEEAKAAVAWSANLVTTP